MCCVIKLLTFQYFKSKTVIPVNAKSNKLLVSGLGETQQVFVFSAVLKVSIFNLQIPERRLD